MPMALEAVKQLQEKLSHLSMWHLPLGLTTWRAHKVTFEHAEVSLSQ